MGNLFKLMPLFFQMSFRVKEESESHVKIILHAIISGDESALLLFVDVSVYWRGRKKGEKKSLLFGIYQIMIVGKKPRTR